MTRKVRAVGSLALLRCARCGEEKRVPDDFYIRSETNKPSSHCRNCIKARSREWDKSHRERKNEATRRGRRSHPERTRQLSAQQRERHREQRRAASRARYWQQRDRLLALTKDYRRRCPEVQQAVSRRWKLPLARNGPHTADNIRPAHFGCNCSKGARVIAS